MENTGQENTNIGESLETSDNNTMLPIIIEKEKKPRKKRETQSAAQIEALCKGREILKQNRKKQRELKKQGVVIDKTSPDYMKEFKDTFDNMIKMIEGRFNGPSSRDTMNVHHIQCAEYTRTPTPIPPPPPTTPIKPRIIFV